MRSRLLNRSLLAVAALLIALGCATRSDYTPTALSEPDGSHTTSYFPLTSGWVSTFDVTNSGGTSSLTFAVGSEVPFLGSTAHQYVISSSNGSSDTNFVIVNQSAVLVYASSTSTPEQLLRLPLQIGASWLRNPDTGLPTNDTTSIITGGEDKDGTDTTYGGDGQTLKKLLPLTGANEMQVEAVDELSLGDGQHFSGAYRVSNEGTSGTSNYYWYVSGVGLVKFVLGASVSNPNGSSRGEIVSYGVR